MDLNNMSPAVRAAIARRTGSGANTPQLQQVTHNAPTASAPVNPNPLPQSAMTKSSSIPTPPKTGSLSYAPQNQSDQIVSGLIETLKANQSLDKEKLKASQGIPLPQAQASVPDFNSTPPQNAGAGVFGSPTTMPVNAQGGGNPLSPGGANPF